MWRRMMGIGAHLAPEGSGGTGGSGEIPPPPATADLGQGPPPPGRGAVPPGYERQPWRMRKSPALASILSIFPGLGQVYVGYYMIGFRNVLIFAAVITILANSMMRGLEPLLGIFLAFFYFYQILDANRRARLYNRTIEGATDGIETLPELPDTRPGPVFGVAIMIFGFLLLLESRWGFDLYWIREWWPLLLIGAGAYITWKNLQERSQSRG